MMRPAQRNAASLVWGPLCMLDYIEQFLQPGILRIWKPLCWSVLEIKKYHRLIMEQ